MAWTQSDLDALETALKTGIRSVTYADRTVVYQTLTEMLQLRDAMKQSVAATAGTTFSTYASFSKG